MDRFARRFATQILALFAALTVLAACSGPEERMARAMERGDEFFEIRDYEKARVEFSNVLQIDPNNNDAIYMTGRAAEGLQDYRTAAAAYRAVLEDDPAHFNSMAALARMMVFAGEAGMAMQTIEPGLAASPDHIGLLTVRAAAHAALGDPISAQADAEAVVARDASAEDAVALLAGLFRIRGENDRAIELVRDAIERSPDSNDMRLILAQLYQIDGDLQGAEDEMLGLIAMSPDEMSYRNRLAQFYLATNRAGDAEAILRDNIEREPDVIEHKVTLINFLQAQESWDAAEAQLQSFVSETPDDALLRLALGQFYETNGYDEDAEEVFEAVIDMAGDEAPALQARNQLASRMLQDGRIDEAETLIEEVIAANARDTAALTMRGTLRLTRNELFDAITDFRTVLRDVPESPNALLGLARSHARNDEPDLAADAYRLLVSVNPTDSAARIEAAQYLNRLGTYDDAVELLNESILAGDSDQPTLEALFQTQMASRDVGAAAATAQQIMETYSDNPVGYFLYGQTREVEGDLDAAETYYQQALDINPRGAEPLNALVRLLARNGRGDEARSMLTQKTLDLPDHAVSRNLLAELLLTDRDYETALLNLNEAIAAAPQWWIPHRTKAAALSARGDIEGAREAYQEGMRSAGAAPGLGIEYAALLDRLGEHEAAIGIYEQLYDANPASDVIANNFAMMLVTHRDDEESLNRAFEAVRSFRNSEVTAFLDTYGWVRLRQGNVDEALSYLRRAAEGLPENPQVRYHYSLALFESGNVAAAHDEVAAAIDAGQDFPELEAARELFSALAERG